MAPHVKPTDLEEYRQASKALKTMGLNENGSYSCGKTSMRLYQDNFDALQALSSWFEQHIGYFKGIAKEDKGLRQ